MQRRKAIHLLLGTAALSLLPRDAFALFRQAHAGLPASPALKTLNPHQDATVTAIAEMIIPQTDTPGAKAVRVNEFIDLILSDWFDDHDRTKFIAGLANLDSQSHDLYGKDFVNSSPVQQKQILTALDEETTEIRQAELHASARRRRYSTAVEKPFFHTMKQLTLVGYFTSEEGAKQALHYEIIPSQHIQCAPLPEEAEAAK
jgi:hypothetical protein